jgi:hypothetical protein
MKTKIANPLPLRLLLFACMIGLLFCSCGTGKPGISNRKELKKAGRSGSGDGLDTIFYQLSYVLEGSDSISGIIITDTIFVNIIFSTNQDTSAATTPISKVADSLYFVLDATPWGAKLDSVAWRYLLQISGCTRGTPNRFKYNSWHGNRAGAASECFLNIAGCTSALYKIDGHLVVVLQEGFPDECGCDVSIPRLQAFKGRRPIPTKLVPTQQVGN